MGRRMKEAGKGVYETEDKFYPTGWCDLDVSLPISIYFLSHIYTNLSFTPSAIPALLICVKLKLFISGEREIILWRDEAR